MDIGSNKGLFTLLAVVIFGIFLSMSYWLFQDELKNVLANVMGNAGVKVENMIIGTNIVEKTEAWYGFNTTRELSGDGILFSSLGQAYAGIGVGHDIIEPYNRYTLTFDITKLSGEITHIGGHGFLSDATEVYIDGVLTSNDWSGGSSLYPNDQETHRIVVNFNSNRIESSTGIYKGIYIQPNRGHYVDLTKAFSVRVDNLSIVKN